MKKHTAGAQYGVSEAHWKSLDEREQEAYSVIRPLRQSNYRVDYHLSRVNSMVDGYQEDAHRMGGVLDLNPDFQRGHVWSREKQIAYMENFMRGVAPNGLRFNCAGWGNGNANGDINPNDMVCVDGLQRLTAMRQFMDGEFQVFGRYLAHDLVGTDFDPKRIHFSVEIFDIKDRAELLQFYLDINRGGVVHTDEEIARVEGLLEEVRGTSTEKPVASSPKKPPRAG
jgi:hypothetical protein